MSRKKEEPSVRAKPPIDYVALPHRELLDVEEAAVVLGLCINTVRTLMKQINPMTRDYVLRYIRVGRYYKISRNAIRQFIEEQERSA